MRGHSSRFEVRNGYYGIACHRGVEVPHHEPYIFRYAAKIRTVEGSCHTHARITATVEHAGEPIDNRFGIADPSRCRHRHSDRQSQYNQRLAFRHLSLLNLRGRMPRAKTIIWGGLSCVLTASLEGN